MAARRSWRDMRIPPLKSKNLLHSNPLKSRVLVRRLGRGWPGLAWRRPSLAGCGAIIIIINAIISIIIITNSDYCYYYQVTVTTIITIAIITNSRAGRGLAWRSPRRTRTSASPAPGGALSGHIILHCIILYHIRPNVTWRSII